MNRWEDFWRVVCRYAPYYYVLLVLLTVMAVLNLAAVLLAGQSTETFVVSTMVFVIVGITAAGVAFVLWRCKQV